MKLIANETEYARRCLEQNIMDKKPYKSIRAVVRYLNRVCHIDDINIIYDSVQSYINAVGKRVTISIDTIKTFIYEDSPYNELERVYISKKEMDTIMACKYPYSWKKILFTMLVQYKVKLAIYPEARNSRIEADLSIIMNDAHTTLTLAKRMEMLARFEEDGLIEMPNGGKQAKYIYLQYVDNEPEEVAVVVEDFFDFYLYFEQYVKGGRLIRCSECGKLVLTQGNKTQYCKKCAKELIKERDRQR